MMDGGGSGEWQGDLTKTQIFTASNKSKQESAAAVSAAGTVSQAAPPLAAAAVASDFPIGHFNAEEAAQKIKRAVGVSLSFHHINHSLQSIISFSSFSHLDRSSK